MESCGCVYADYDSVNILRHDIIKSARKTHICGECRRIIKIGESYDFMAYESEGEFETYKICCDCQSVIDAFFCNGSGFGMVWRDLKDHFFEMDGRINSDCILKLTPGARDKVFKIIEDVWADLALDEE